MPLPGVWRKCFLCYCCTCLEDVTCAPHNYQFPIIEHFGSYGSGTVIRNYPRASCYWVLCAPLSSWHLLRPLSGVGNVSLLYAAILDSNHVWKVYKWTQNLQMLHPKNIPHVRSAPNQSSCSHLHLQFILDYKMPWTRPQFQNETYSVFTLLIELHWIDLLRINLISGYVYTSGAKLN